MSVNFEIKGMLAKLLATEDILVEHRNVDTASFNVDTRTLVLPIWSNASENIYDMLISHEISHSLLSPNCDWTKTHKIPHSYVNIAEDCRVERLIKRRYAGLPKVFYKGYKELYEQDFFEIADEDVSSMNLADRANLYFKIGNFLDISFTEEEKEIISLIENTETFEDVLYAAQKLYDYCKKDLDENQIPHSLNGLQAENLPPSTEDDKNEDSSSNNENTEEGNEESKENNDSQESSTKSSYESNETEHSNSYSNSSSPSTVSENIEPKTVSKLEEKIKQLAIKNFSDTVYVEVPKVNLNHIIVSNKEIYKELESSFTSQQEKYTETHNDGTNIFKSSDSEFKQFKISSQKEVNYLVKEFECRKAADSYSRSHISRTGVLDCSRLHSYRFTDDVFKKITTIPEGKNHGLIFILDWSGSMSNVILDTLKQLYNLMWFCKKVSIPFEVYAFTNEWRRFGYDYTTGKYTPVEMKEYYTKKPGLLSVSENFSLMNIFNHKTSSRELEKQMIYIWRLGKFFSNPYGMLYHSPTKMGLSGTPLNESLICLYQLIPQFQSTNKLQKVHCIILTDGEADPPPYHVEIGKKDSENYMIGTRGIKHSSTILRDKELGTTYKSEYLKFSDTLLRNLQDKFLNVNFIGIRLLSGRDASGFVSRYHPSSESEYKKIQNQWKKDGSFTLKTSGYDAYFGISSNSLSQNSEFEIQENATKTQIKNAFSKSLKMRKLNKRVLGEFISLIV